MRDLDSIEVGHHRDASGAGAYSLQPLETGRGYLGMRDCDWIASQVQQAEFLRRHQRRRALRSFIARALRFGSGGAARGTDTWSLDARTDASEAELVRAVSAPTRYAN